MGLMKHLIREIKHFIQDIFGVFKRKKKRKPGAPETVKVPSSWQNRSSAAHEKTPGKDLVVIRHKKKLPGLKTFNRALAGILLFFNFIFSQFLLGSIGSGAQPMFLLFMGNCYCLALLLWKYRKKEGSQK